MDRILRDEIRGVVTQPTYLDVVALRAFGRTRHQAHALKVCLRCGKPPVTRDDAEVREYAISGICGPCFDTLFPPDTDETVA